MASFNRRTGARFAIPEGRTQAAILCMQSSDLRDVRLDSAAALASLVVLADAEWRVLEINEQIERQRRLIEELVLEGKHIASAQVIFDSLCISLSLALQDRHRLRA